MKQKNRYIVAYYTLLPRKGVNTAIKGWMDNPNNTQWDERFEMTEGLKSRHTRDAQVILDLDEKKIVKNWKANEGENDYNKILDYYLMNYSANIDKFMAASDKQRDQSIQTEEKVD